MSQLEFKDISDEPYREYNFGDDVVVKVVGLELNVSASGGHRIKAADGFSYYIPSGWVSLRWIPKEGKDAFQF